MLVFKFFYNIFFRFNMNAIKRDNSSDIMIISIKLNGESPKLPNGTFIPIKEATMVGIEQTIVILARNFITSFKLLDIIVA